MSMLRREKTTYEAPLVELFGLRTASMLQSFSNNANLDDFIDGGELDSEIDPNP